MDDLDRILSSEEPIIPSSGFTGRVMDAIGDAAAQPPPLPFPWIRFVPGLIGSGVAAAAGVPLLESIGAATAAAAPALELAAAIVGACLCFVYRRRLVPGD